MTGWRARLARGAGALSAVEVGGIAVAYAAHILFARWMGPREFGLYAYVMGWSSVLAILPTLGLADAGMRFVAEYRARGDWGRLRGVIGTSERAALAAGAALGLGGTAVIVALDRWHGLSAPQAMVIGVWMAPLLGLVLLLRGLGRGLTHVALAFAPHALLRPLLVLLAGGVLVWAHGPPSGVGLLTAGLAVLPLVVLVQLAMLRGAVRAAVPPAPPVHDRRAWLEVAFPLLLVNGAGLVMTYSGLLGVGGLLGPTDAGLYHVASRTASLITLSVSLANAFAAPHFAALYAEGNRQGLQSLTTTVTRWSFWSSAVIALALVAFAEPVLGLFGRGFVGAWPVLAVLAIGQVVNAGAGPVGTLLNMTGRHGVNLRVTLWTMAANVVLTVAGVLALGVAGAALAAAATMTAWNVWLHRLAARELGIDTSILRDVWVPLRHGAGP
jgi:O-antigen/teichoic acid export membrane protein